MPAPVGSVRLKLDARDLPSLNGKFKNKRFCEKRGLPLAEEYRD